jgi:hypothetical protein
MSILNNLEKVHAAVVVDNFKGKPKGALGEKLGVLAVKAITGGIKSAEWKSYMSLFADNAAQLNLLTVPTDGEDSWLPQSRAYIVSNAVCAAGTNTQTGNRVDTRMGTGLDETPDGTIDLRPFPIPEV